MLGILNVTQFDPEDELQAGYRPMLEDFLTTVFPGKELKFYEIPAGDFPQRIDECNMWIITGSAKSASEELPWILRLKEFIQNCHQSKTKLVGICFGHQLIALALGGWSERSPKGWDAGVREFRFLAQKNWMSPPLEKGSLIVSHQDQVEELPEGAVHLAESEFCKFEMFSIGEHILGIQGHPDFTPAHALKLYNSREKQLGPELYKKAVDSLSHGTCALDIWKWIRIFLNS